MSASCTQFEPDGLHLLLKDSMLLWPDFVAGDRRTSPGIKRNNLGMMREISLFGDELQVLVRRILIIHAVHNC